MYRAIIFDFFDVVYADAFKRWLAKRGLKREGVLKQASEDLDTGKIDLAECEKRIASVVGITVEQFTEELNEFRILNQEILPLIDSLGKNYMIGLLSNAASAFLRDLLHTHGLDPKFHHIVISSEVGMAKPNPEIFEHILAKMNVSTNEAIFIDDTEKNVEAAEKLGITGLVFTDTKTLYRDLEARGIKT